MVAFLLCLVILFPSRSSAQSAGTVSIGASIVAAENSDPWRSPSGDFAFGFQQLPGNRNLFILSIWFDKIPDKTIVWHEKKSYPVQRGSTVRLEATTGIVLRNPRRELLYNSSGFTGRVANGFLNDTGNFVLQGSDSTSLWESFKNPTDTILPTQIIETGGRLISRVTATNYSEGRFYASMEKGEFKLVAKSKPNNSDANDYFESPGTGYDRLVFNTLNELNVIRQNGSRYDLTHGWSPSAPDSYYRVTLEFDGVLVQYQHPKNSTGNSTWVPITHFPKDICGVNAAGYGSGVCGFNSVCTRQDGRRPVCNCPKGFSLVDPDNVYGGCKPNYAQYCVEGYQQALSADEYELSEIPNVDWGGGYFERLSPSTEDQCRNFCLSDCLCGAVVFSFRVNACWKKRLPLSDGRDDTSQNLKTFIKFRKDDGASVNRNHSSFDKSKKDQRTSILVNSLLGSSVFINCLLIVVGCLGFFRIYRKKSKVFSPTRDALGSNLRYFSYRELCQATDGFKEELGRGSFGIVYRGMIVLSNGAKSIVAVKKLDRMAQDSEKEFRTEVNVIGQTHHRNLVHLVGFCDEGSHRLLVYEHMCNGTLASLLFGDIRPSWSQRIQIALGVARGLTYLHEECSTQIMHCDIKPQNILLDEFYNARISDFGLAKILVMNQSRTLTNIRGTKGYVAPEWFKNTQVTVKVDVYSFGVLLLEIITCRKSVNTNINITDEENPFLIDWVLDCFMEKRLDVLVGEDEEAQSDRKTLERFMMVGIWCIQEDASVRPAMKTVCQMLDGVVEVEVPPCPNPSFTTSTV